MNDKGKPKMYIASCSFGKDSLATILLALENNEPLDRVVFSEVMFDHSRNISGEIPEHIEWVYDVAIPRLEGMGVKVDVVRAKKDYLYYNRNDNPNGKYTVKNAVVTLDKVGAPGKWSGADLSWGGNNVYTKVLDKPILKLDKKIILGSWQTSNNRVLTFYDDGTYTFPDNSKPRKAFQLTTCGVLLDGISGVFVLTSDSTGAWCSSGGGKPLDYVKK